LPGIELGKGVLLYLEGLGQAETAVSYLYMALLGGLGLYMLHESRRSASRRPVGGSSSEGFGGQIAGKLQQLHLPPLIHLHQSQISSLSLWVLSGLGLIIGILAGLLGVGGGFVMMPSMVYLLGLPTQVAVGTQLLTIVITGGFGSFTYALANRVDLLAAAIMLVGASAGAQVGTVATKYVKGARIRFYFAITILAAGVSVALKQLAAYPGLGHLSLWALYLVLAAAGGMSLAIVGLLIAGWSEGVRQEEAEAS